jgi:hypothetical protein
VPVLVAAAILGAAALRRRRPAIVRWIGPAVVAVALVSNYLLGPIPLWRWLPGGETLQARGHEVTEHDRIAARAVKLVPDGEPVSVSNSLGAHLSARRRVLSVPYVQDARWIAVDETSPGYADRIAPLPYAQRIAQIRRNPRWQLVFEEDGVLVFRRR